MNALEERIRAAACAAADTVPPDGVPPLRLPADRYGPRSWARRLAPVAAAAAMVAVAVAAVAVGRAVHRGHQGQATTAPVPGPPVSWYVETGQVPRYYVALTSRGNPNVNPSYAVVQATATGKTLATVRPHAANGTIVAVTAAADDRTFVLDEQRWVTPESNANQAYQARAFYLMRLTPAGRVASLARLPMSVPGGQLMTGLALSPDGSKLAMAIQPLNVRNEPDLTQLKVYTLASGTARTWTGNGTIGASGDDARSLSWTAGQRTLAFDWGGSGPHASSGVRLLDLAAGGTDLLADSRLAASLRPLTSAGTVAPPPATASTLPTVATLPTVPSTASALPFKGSALAPAGGQSSLTCQEDSIITPDGSAVVCGATRILPQTGSGAEPGMGIGTATVETGFIEYPTAAGRATRILGRWKIGNVAAAGVQVLWSDASGTILIGVIPGPGDPFGVRTGVIRGDEFSPLPQPAGASPGSGTW